MSAPCWKSATVLPAARSPLSAASPEALGYSHYFAELIDEWAADQDPAYKQVFYTQILPDLISFTLYRLETNIRAASVLGLIGAGGIGYLMNTSFRTFQYQEAAAIVLVLIALVMRVDYLSSRLRTLVV